MTRWKISTGDVKEYPAEGDVAAFYTASFTCMNMETNQPTTVTLGQLQGGPVSDLIGALMSLTELLRRASEQKDDDEPAPRMH
jgi:hypothetical protein